MQREKINWIVPNEADIVQYFGKIRNGKTYIATSDIIDLLRRGHVVYANWKINYDGYDEWNNPFFRFLGLIGLKKTFVSYPKENLKYIKINQEFFDKFATLTDCDVFLDEGHLAFNSYEMTRMDLGKQASILHTGHFGRSIRIVSQRTMNIHVQMRANVNVFIKCEKIFSFLKFNIFRKTYFEEMLGTGDVDLEEPSGSKLYIGQKRIYNAYDTKYLRMGTPQSQFNTRYETKRSWKEQVDALTKRIKK